MSSPLRVFGSELSPYSVKVRAYLRFKGIPHEWIIRNAGNMAEFQRYARLPLIPLVVTPEDKGMQDSTPILEKLEAQHPEPAIHPEDPSLAFLSALLEEYGDEWGNKCMFHYRWWYEENQIDCAARIARDNLPGAEEEQIQQMANAIRERMVPRLSFVGSNETTRPIIESSFERQLTLLEKHLADRPYLFGGRPAFGDFGLAPQLWECASDPTPRGRMEEVAPLVLAWTNRMLEPKVEAPFEAWDSLQPTLGPLFESEVAGLFLPWTTANAKALAAGEKEFRCELEGRPFGQETQKYHARSLGVLRQRYADVAEKNALDPILEATGCLGFLA